MEACEVVSPVKYYFLHFFCGWELALRLLSDQLKSGESVPPDHVHVTEVAPLFVYELLVLPRLVRINPVLCLVHCPPFLFVSLSCIFPACIHAVKYNKNHRPNEEKYCHKEFDLRHKRYSII